MLRHLGIGPVEASVVAIGVGEAAALRLSQTTNFGTSPRKAKRLVRTQIKWGRLLLAHASA